ncbi:hypothetical protein [Streptomyces cinereoruber]|uniref:hypothetical protein n=1 Tax=Streptomyces cinereoruber TaxID=67260 RepID=UPI00365265D9
MKLEIIWETPPAQGGHELIAEKLRKEPGRWARIEKAYPRKSASAFAYSVNHGRRPAYAPEGDFEACWRMKGDAAYVYVRFLGDGVSDE